LSKQWITRASDRPDPEIAIGVVDRDGLRAFVVGVEVGQHRVEVDLAQVGREIRRQMHQRLLPIADDPS
jgi:hypothetical protein